MPTGFALSRRSLLAGAAGGLVLATAPLRAFAQPSPSGGRISDPFTLGVASGDPLPDAVVLWTRLAPTRWQARTGQPLI